MAVMALPVEAIVLVAKAECVPDCVCPAEVHEAGKLNPEWWARQKFIGLQPVDEEFCLEMRNCLSPGCQSTLAIVVPMTAERVTMIEESMRRAREMARMVESQISKFRRLS